ncbi:hypothetical protein [Natronorubrum halophilum]|uniref:hypothetical protein n=1 Tax=Natronorubrum halophilum TaxID=1702106 RepID=UPI000EF65E35|nr:hypothetical protein [Natronorubrum halophilum]
MKQTEEDLSSDLIIVVGFVFSAVVLFYGLISGKILLSLIVVLLLMVARALYKILAAISRIETTFSSEQ